MSTYHTDSRIVNYTVQNDDFVKVQSIKIAFVNVSSQQCSPTNIDDPTDKSHSTFALMINRSTNMTSKLTHKLTRTTQADNSTMMD